MSAFHVTLKKGTNAFHDSLIISPPLSADHSNVLACLAMAGKFGIAASFAVIYVYTAEIFPTVLR